MSSTEISTIAPQPQHGIRQTRPRDPDAPRGNQDFTDLATVIHGSGLMRRRYGYYWAKLAVLATVVAGTIVAFVWIGDTWWQLFTAVIFGMIFTQAAFLGHDAAHRQIFVSSRWNDWTSLVVGNLVVGMSYGWWKHKHTRHHVNPNKKGSDPDIELPVISFTPEQAKKPRGPILSWLVAHQGVFFFPILPLEGLSLHVSSVRRLLAREKVDRRWVELAFIGIRLVGFAALAFLVLSPGIAAVFLAVQIGVFGFWLAASFSPNHKGMPLVPKDMKLDFLRRQVLMSRNVRGGRVVDFVLGGLNYQVEHHLFPSMPRPHLRRAAPIIEAHCVERGVKYTQMGLFASYREIIRYINRVGLGEGDAFSCPLVEQRAAV